MKLLQGWCNRLHVRGLGKGWWELAGWAAAQRKPQRTDQALEGFHAYLPDTPAGAVTKSLPDTWGGGVLLKKIGGGKEEKREKQNPKQWFMGHTEGCESYALTRRHRQRCLGIWAMLAVRGATC